MINILKKYKTQIKYLIFGVLTTVVDFVISFFLYKVTNHHIANIAAWCGAVIFAYAVNKIFVFESKNYSGWIYGNEAQRNWTQTLLAKRGRSRRLYFYNPVKQNQSHIRHLKKLVGDRIPMHSLIVFSNRCTLKKISVKSANIHVLYRHDIRPTVAKIWNRAPADALTQTEIADIYNQLYPYTQVSDAVKEKHIANVEGKH